MENKTFKTAFIAIVPDVDPEQHKSIIKSPLYELTSILVKDADQAVEIAKQMAQEGIQSFILCPGFTHKAIARIVDAVGEDVSVTVARGDPPSNKAAFKIMDEVGFFKN